MCWTAESDACETLSVDLSYQDVFKRMSRQM